MSCGEVKTVFTESSCCQAPSETTTCLHTIPTCDASENGDVCVESPGKVVVKGLREAFDLSAPDRIVLRKHLIPEQNAALDLGNAERKVRHLFLSDF